MSNRPSLKKRNTLPFLFLSNRRLPNAASQEFVASTTIPGLARRIRATHTNGEQRTRHTGSRCRRRVVGIRRVCTRSTRAYIVICQNMPVNGREEEGPPMVRQDHRVLPSARPGSCGLRAAYELRGGDEGVDRPPASHSPPVFPPRPATRQRTRTDIYTRY